MSINIKISHHYADLIFADKESSIKLDITEDEFFEIQILKINSLFQLCIIGNFKRSTDNATVGSFTNNIDQVLCVGNETNPLIKGFFDSYYLTLKEKMKQVFSLIRWQYNWGDGNKSAVSTEEMFWSADGSAWNKFIDCPQISGFEVIVSGGYSPEQNHLTELLKDGISEPVYQEMIREAISIKAGNIRSAYVIAVAALETCLKSFINKLLPKAEYLLTEMPSPPIDKLIKNYLPLLDPKFVIDVSSNRLQQIIKNRNKLIHLGRVQFSLEQGFADIRLINNIIHEIDHFLGHPLSLEFRQRSSAK